MSEDWFKKYHNYESIKTFYKTLAENNRELVTYVPSIGQSVEGRDMIALHITASKSPERLKYYIQCQIHAREWISGATCQYLAKKLVESYTTDHKVKNLLDQLEFVMVPVVNPDGYEYTWKQNRLWRKNRSYNEGSSCRGVDLNRNFEKGWGVEERSNTAPCSETYHGLRANSEPEVRNVVEYFKKHRPIAVGLDMHSYSELLLTPWGYERQDPIDETYLSNLGKKLAEMINKVHGSKYVTEKSIDLYRATGIAGDWFYSDDVIEGNNGYRPISITIELRDKGNYGFLLPKSEIIPTGEEIWPAIVELGEQILHKPLKFTSYEFYK
jgi:murein tripeptide amidase MpaA